MIQTQKIHVYEYKSGNPHIHLHLRKQASWGTHYLAAFPTGHLTNYRENNTAYGEYFLPKGTPPFRFLILLPGLGDAMLIPCRMLARNLAKKEIASFLLYSSWHSRRTPEALKKADGISLGTDQWLESFKVSVADVRTLLDWSEQRTEIDSRRIAITGISIGGFVATIAMGIDKRISAGALLLTGGNLEEITWKSKSHFLRRIHSGDRGDSERREECHRIYSQYPHYLEEVKKKGFMNVISPKECFLFDPVTFAHYLCGRPLLMINARWDSIIPKRSVLNLWEECGKPPLIWFPCSHLTFFFWYPLIRRKLASFLQYAL